MTQPKWTRYFKQVNSIMPVQGAYSKSTSVDRYSSWLPEVYQGPPNRLHRYTQYEIMDLDHEISAALDTLSEFCTQLDERNATPFIFRYKEEATETEIKILERMLKNWCALNDFQRRMFKIFRNSLKFGDQFFIRDPETYALLWVDPNTVEKVIVNEAEGKKIEAYLIKNISLNLSQKVVSNMHNQQTTTGIPSYNYISGTNANTGSYASYAKSESGKSSATDYTIPVDSKHVVHLSRTDGMDPAWPFGVSVLERIFKIYKQKEMLEDAVLIYRIHRAPERRVFHIDTGSLPPNKAHQYLERVKNEVQQKRIPSRTGGGANITDASYNPLSILEDYFFASTSDGRGSKVETLPGGENLGSIDDLKYFNNKMMRALGVPSSYLPTGPEDGSNPYTDGRVGTAFIQEFRFQKACLRYQNEIINSLDNEFKMFLKFKGVSIDSSKFELIFTEPTNFSSWRQIDLYSSQLSNFATIAEVPYISKRFALKKYAGWTDEEIMENERKWKEENKDKLTNIPSDEAAGSSTQPNLQQVGVSPSSFDIADEEDVDIDMDTDTEGVSDNEIDNFGEEQP